MSQTTLELPESDGAAPAEPRPTRVNDAPDDGKGLEFHFAELREVLGEHSVDYAEAYLQSLVRCLRRDLHEPSPGADADKHYYEEELYKKLVRIRHIAASLRNTASEGDKTSLSEVRSLALTIEEMAEPLPETCGDLMGGLGGDKQVLRIARVDSYNPPHTRSGRVRGLRRRGAGRCDSGENRPRGRPKHDREFSLRNLR